MYLGHQNMFEYLSINFRSHDKNHNPRWTSKNSLPKSTCAIFDNRFWVELKCSHSLFGENSINFGKIKASGRWSNGFRLELECSHSRLGKNSIEFGKIKASGRWFNAFRLEPERSHSRLGKMRQSLKRSVFSKMHGSRGMIFMYKYETGFLWGC